QVNFCANSPCLNGGVCTASHSGHVCTCPEGRYGKNCEFSGRDCDSNPCQHVDAKCTISDNGGYVCECPIGLSGVNCEIDSLNECNSNPCQHADAVCQDKPGDYACYCPPRHAGKNCEVYDSSSPGGLGREVCANSPCLNGGVCTASHSGHVCTCPEGRYGKNCEFSGRDCDSNPCQHVDAKCTISDNGGYVCECPIGLSGVNCEIGFYEKDLERQRRECLENKCPLKRGNYRCDEECNKYACDFDGNDCSLGINPWINCTAPIRCWEVFMDGVCNEDCNNAQCLFDGRDCEKTLQPCNPIYDGYCQKHYANGFCDYGCDNAEC
nr:Notch [Cucujiformia]